MKRSLLITGGAGFIGCNAASRFHADGWDVKVLDNLSRKGATENLKWIKKNLPGITFIKADISNQNQLVRAVAKVGKLDAILHFAGQVAVTTSVVDPRDDFNVNALGTFNLLEAVRNIYGITASRHKKNSPLILYSSTNKVYGGMDNVRITEKNGRYGYRDLPHGIPEERLLDFHSPYGCSKGAADQYIIDYARIYGMRTAAFRQSCIYGYRQFGVEDQGWVAWFIIAAVLGKKITIYGDGKQVRDILFIDDLIDAYRLAIENADKISGAYNIGGGSKNTISLLELLAMIEKLSGQPVKTSFGPWRPGDQPVFVCDVRKAKKSFGWSPKTNTKKGVALLYRWVTENRNIFEKFF